MNNYVDFFVVKENSFCMKKFSLSKISLGILLVLVLATALIIPYVSVNKYNKNSKEFISDGYVLSEAQEGSESINQEYYFNGGEKYRETYDNKVNFDDINGNKVSIDIKNFLHYQNGSMNGLSSSVLLDTDNVQEQQASYYSIQSSSILEKQGDKYQIATAGGAPLNFTNFLWKISNDRYMVVSPTIKYVVSEKAEQTFKNYVELRYIDEGIAHLVTTQDGTYSTVSSDAYLELENGIRVYIGSKNISDDEKILMNLTQMVVDSDDNIEVIPDEDYTIEDDKQPQIIVNANDGETGANGEEGETGENGKNGDPGLSGNPGGQGNPGTDAPNANVQFEAYQIPEFIIENLDVTSYSVDATLKYTDNDVAVNSAWVTIVDKQTGNEVYRKNITNDPGLTAVIPDLEHGKAPLLYNGLNSDTEYSYNVICEFYRSDSGITKETVDKDKTKLVNQVLAQQDFKTDSLGLRLDKKYITSDSITLTLTKESLSDAKNVRILLFNEYLVAQNDGTPKRVYDNEGELILDCPNILATTTDEESLYNVTSDGEYLFDVSQMEVGDSFDIEFPNLDDVNKFDKLNSNSYYYAQIKVEDIEIGEDLYVKPKNSYGKQKYLTLKRDPSLGIPTVYTNEATSTFAVYPGSIVDLDLGIVSYRYDIYNKEDFGVEGKDPIYSVRAENPSDIAIPYTNKPAEGEDVSETGNIGPLYRNQHYYAQLVAIFNNNEQVVEFKSSPSNEFYVGDTQLPTVTFAHMPYEVTASTIEGRIKISDEKGNLTENSSVSLKISTNKENTLKLSNKNFKLNLAEKETDDHGHVIGYYYDFYCMGLSKDTTYTIAIYADDIWQYDSNTETRTQLSKPGQPYCLGSENITTKDSYNRLFVDRTDYLNGHEYDSNMFAFGIKLAPSTDEYNDEAMFRGYPSNINYLDNKLNNYGDFSGKSLAYLKLDLYESKKENGIEQVDTNGNVIIDDSKVFMSITLNINENDIFNSSFYNKMYANSLNAEKTITEGEFVYIITDETFVKYSNLTTSNKQYFVYNKEDGKYYYWNYKVEDNIASTYTDKFEEVLGVSEYTSKNDLDFVGAPGKVYIVKEPVYDFSNPESEVIDFEITKYIWDNVEKKFIEFDILEYEGRENFPHVDSQQVINPFVEGNTYFIKFSASDYLYTLSSGKIANEILIGAAKNDGKCSYDNEDAYISFVPDFAVPEIPKEEYQKDLLTKGLAEVHIDTDKYTYKDLSSYPNNLPISTITEGITEENEKTNAVNTYLKNMWQQLDTNTHVGIEYYGPNYYKIAPSKKIASVCYNLYKIDDSNISLTDEDFFSINDLVSSSGWLPYTNKMPVWTYFFNITDPITGKKVERGEKFYIETKIILKDKETDDDIDVSEYVLPNYYDLYTKNKDNLTSEEITIFNDYKQGTTEPLVNVRVYPDYYYYNLKHDITGSKLPNVDNSDSHTWLIYRDFTANKQVPTVKSVAYDAYVDKTNTDEIYLLIKDPDNAIILDDTNKIALFHNEGVTSSSEKAVYVSSQSKSTISGLTVFDSVKLGVPDILPTDVEYEYTLPSTNDLYFKYFRTYAGKENDDIFTKNLVIENEVSSNNRLVFVNYNSSDDSLVLNVQFVNNKNIKIGFNYRSTGDKSLDTKDLLLSTDILFTPRISNKPVLELILHNTETTGLANKVYYNGTRNHLFLYNGSEFSEIALINSISIKTAYDSYSNLVSAEKESGKYYKVKINNKYYHYDGTNLTEVDLSDLFVYSMTKNEITNIEEKDNDKIYYATDIDKYYRFFNDGLVELDIVQYNLKANHKNNGRISMNNAETHSYKDANVVYCDSLPEPVTPNIEYCVPKIVDSELIAYNHYLNGELIEVEPIGTRYIQQGLIDLKAIDIKDAIYDANFNMYYDSLGIDLTLYYDDGEYGISKIKKSNSDYYLVETSKGEYETRDVTTFNTSVLNWGSYYTNDNSSITKTKLMNCTEYSFVRNTDNVNPENNGDFFVSNTDANVYYKLNNIGLQEGNIKSVSTSKAKGTLNDIGFLFPDVIVGEIVRGYSTALFDISIPTIKETLVDNKNLYIVYDRTANSPNFANFANDMASYKYKTLDYNANGIWDDIEIADLRLDDDKTKDLDYVYQIWGYVNDGTTDTGRLSCLYPNAGNTSSKDAFTLTAFKHFGITDGAKLVAKANATRNDKNLVYTFVMKDVIKTDLLKLKHTNVNGVYLHIYDLPSTVTVLNKDNISSYIEAETINITYEQLKTAFENKNGSNATKGSLTYDVNIPWEPNDNEEHIMNSSHNYFVDIEYLYADDIVGTSHKRLDSYDVIRFEYNKVQNWTNYVKNPSFTITGTKGYKTVQDPLDAKKYYSNYVISFNVEVRDTYGLMPRNENGNICFYAELHQIVNGEDSLAKGQRANAAQTSWDIPIRKVEISNVNNKGIGNVTLSYEELSNNTTYYVKIYFTNDPENIWANTSNTSYYDISHRYAINADLSSIDKCMNDSNVITMLNTKAYYLIGPQITTYSSSNIVIEAAIIHPNPDNEKAFVEIFGSRLEDVNKIWYQLTIDGVAQDPVEVRSDSIKTKFKEIYYQASEATNLVYYLKTPTVLSTSSNYSIDIKVYANVEQNLMSPNATYSTIYIPE